MYEPGIFYEFPREFQIKLCLVCGECCVSADSLSDLFFQSLICFLPPVTNKMTAGAKSFGSFFTGVVNKAGAKIKETVKDNVSNFVMLFYSLS